MTKTEGGKKGRNSLTFGEDRVFANIPYFPKSAVIKFEHIRASWRAS